MISVKIQTISRKSSSSCSLSHKIPSFLTSTQHLGICSSRTYSWRPSCSPYDSKLTQTNISFHLLMFLSGYFYIWRAAAALAHFGNSLYWHGRPMKPLLSSIWFSFCYPWPWLLPHRHLRFLHQNQHHHYLLRPLNRWLLSTDAHVLCQLLPDRLLRQAQAPLLLGSVECSFRNWTHNQAIIVHTPASYLLT